MNLGDMDKIIKMMQYLKQCEYMIINMSDILNQYISEIGIKDHCEVNHADICIIESKQHIRPATIKEIYEILYMILDKHRINNN